MENNAMKRILCIALAALCLMGAAACQKKQEEEAVNPDLIAGDYPIATIAMKDGRKIVLELYPDVAPESVKNFISLANAKYYDGVIFHRVIYGFMIQGGCPEGTGRSGPGYNIFGEFPNNGWENDIKHKRGVLSMARQGNQYDPASAYNTAGSQFFITHRDRPDLDGNYAPFGRVIEGLDVVDEIASVTTDAGDKPRVPQVMASIRVETFGVDYGEPNKL